MESGRGFGGRRRAAKEATLVLSMAVAGGCVGSGQGRTVPAVGPPPPAAALATASIASAEPTTWPLPSASLYSHLPPAGSNGGPTKPCPRHVEWYRPPLPDGEGRQAGLGCSDLTPVRYPVCSAEQVARASRIDALLIPGVMAPELFEAGQPRSFSFRGYLRRDVMDAGGGAWSMRIESLGSDGTCREMQIRDRPRGWRAHAPFTSGGYEQSLCHGDESFVCCFSALVDADEEIIYEVTTMEEGQLCVISPAAKQDIIRGTRRAEEKAFDQWHNTGMAIP